MPRSRVLRSHRRLRSIGMWLVPSIAVAVAVPALASTTSASLSAKLTSEVTTSETALVPARLELGLEMMGDTDDSPVPQREIAVDLPNSVTLYPAGFPACSVEQINQHGPTSCPDGSQVGAGAMDYELGPSRAPIAFAVAVYSAGAAGLAISLRSSGGAELAMPGWLETSTDTRYRQQLRLLVPGALRQPVRDVFGSIRSLSVDLAARRRDGSSLVRLGNCPADGLPVKAIVTWDTDMDPAATPTEATAAAGCTLGTLPEPTGPSPTPTPTVQPTPTPTPDRGVRPVPAFRAGRSGARSLRLTGLRRGESVTVRCVRRCGRGGTSLAKATVPKPGPRTITLRRKLTAGMQLEIRVSSLGRLTRFNRYAISKKRTLRLLGGGCLMASGARRACPQ